jgi:hypothetical protein
MPPRVFRKSASKQWTGSKWAVKIARIPKRSSSERWAQSADRFLKIAASVSLAGYLLGFLILNLIYFALWRFVDVHLFSEHCLLVAAVPALLFGFLHGPVRWLRKKLEPLVGPLARLADWKKGLCIIAVPILLFVLPRGMQLFVQRNGASSVPIRIAACLLALVYGLIFFVSLSLGLENGVSKKPIDAIEFDDLLSFLPTVVVLVICTILVLICVPPAAALLVEKKDLLIASEATSVFAPCSRDLAKIQAHPDSEKLHWVSGFSILEKGPSETALWSDECGSILQISNGYIQGARWQTPFTKRRPDQVARPSNER